MQKVVSEKQLSKNRRTLIAVLAVCALPILLALWMFSGSEIYRPDGTANNGILVVPAQPLPVEHILVSGSDQELPAEYLKGKWTLVYFDSADCDKACGDNLYRLSQVRLAMGEDTKRIQILLMASGRNTKRAAEIMEAEYGVTVATVESTQDQVLLQHFDLGHGDPLGLERVYLIDPLGNLMMYYEPDQEPNGILRDLRRLLKWSQIG